jgi:exopolysaccharide biosynthesis polyprenyl glycosylphosphotransferase
MASTRKRGSKSAQRALGGDVVAARSPAPRAPHRGSARARYRRLSLLIGATDAACLLAALVTAYFARYGIRPLFLSYLVATALAPPVWLAVYYAFGLYHPLQRTEWGEFKGILSATSVGVMLAATASFWTHSQLSRKWIAFTWILVLALELATRAAWGHFINRRKASGWLALRTLVIDTSRGAARLADSLAESGTGYKPIGHVAVRGRAEGLVGAYPIVGRICDLEHLITDTRADCVFVGTSAVGAGEMSTISRAVRRTRTSLRVATNIPEMVTAPLPIHAVAGWMVLALRHAHLSGAQYAAKRAFDIVATLLTLVLAAPCMLAAAIAIKATSRGPVFFRQPRVTQGNRVFTMLKFRSMTTDADMYLDLHRIDSAAPFFKLGGTDPRITKVGRVLRKWSIDELPQCFNVLLGDMSLVGPRPLPLEQVSANLARLEPRHEVKAGMTGWWQIRGRSDLTFEEAIALDLYYIENWSLSLDVYIIIKTAGAVLARRGAY